MATGTVVVADDVQVTIDSVLYSDQFSQVAVGVSSDALDKTTFDSGGWREVHGGLKAGEIQVGFLSAEGSGEISTALWTLFLAGDPVAIVVKADAGSTAAGNPTYTGSVLINNLTPVSGGVGELMRQSFTWPLSGSLVRAES